MQLQARDKRALIGGAVVVTGLLAYLLWPRGTDGGAIELVPAAERGAQPQATLNAAPQPPAVAAAQTAAPGQPAGQAPPGQPGTPQQPAPTPGGVPEGLKLTGVTATGAIFAYGDGSQRLVQRGREVAPGLTLQTVRVREVILSGNGTDLRMTFSGPAVPVQAAANPAPAAVPAQPTPPPDRSLFR